MKRFFTAFISFFFPSFLAVYLLRLMGHKIHKSCKIGFSVVLVPKLYMEKGAFIRHFNFVKCDSVTLGEKGGLGTANVVKGSFDVVIMELSSLGNCNMATRAQLGVTYGKAILQLGKMSKFTSFHKLDLTRSIIIGDYTTFAGQASQVWTHGYYHYRTGPGRFRVDGEVHVGNNVYVGSGCLVNAGVKVADGITVGGNSTISKSLEKQGVYVSQPLRYIETDPLEVEKRLKPVTGYNITDIVYEKPL